MQCISYLDKREVLQQEYSQHPILPFSQAVLKNNSVPGSPFYAESSKDCLGEKKFPEKKKFPGHLGDFFLSHPVDSNRIIF